MIPGVETFHARADWTSPAQPITGPAMVVGDVEMCHAHYTADGDLPDGDVGEHVTDVAGYLRAIQNDYMTRPNPFSFGYNYAVDWLGGVWEGRGLDIRPAANNGDFGEWAVINVNRISVAVLYLVDGADRLTDLAAASGRAIMREAERRTVAAGGAWRFRDAVPHSHTDATACPGDGIRTDITAGLLSLDYPEPDGDNNMDDDSLRYGFLWKHTDHPELFWCMAGNVQHIDGDTRDMLTFTNGGPLVRIVSTNEQVYRSYMTVTGQLG